jgi:hypothetical protein
MLLILKNKHMDQNPFHVRISYDTKHNHMLLNTNHT